MVECSKSRELCLMQTIQNLIKVTALLVCPTVLFLSGVLCGYFQQYSILSNNLNNNLNLSAISRNSLALNFMDILNHNMEIIIINIFGGFIFSIPTMLSLFYNGMIIGYDTKLALSHSTLKTVLIFTLPHGIFEIPAIIIAGAAGFKIPYEIIRYLAGRKEQILTKEDIKEYLTLALISIILIVIAAFVEAYVTPRIAEYFLR